MLLFGGTRRMHLRAERSALELEREARQRRARAVTRGWFRARREETARRHEERVARVRATQEAADRLGRYGKPATGVMARLKMLARRVLGR